MNNNGNERKTEGTLPMNRIQENYNVYNTPNQKQKWKGNNQRRPFWKNNGQTNNYYMRPYQQSPRDRKPPFPTWREHEGYGEKTNYYSDRARRDDRSAREDGYFQYEARRERSPLCNNHYAVPVQNRFKQLRRYDEGVRSPWYLKYQQDRFERERTPVHFLEQRH